MKPSPATCSIDDCDQIAYSRGWCLTHYGRWRRFGDPLAPPSKFGRKRREDDDIALTGGRWETRGLIRVWTGPRPVDPKPEKKNLKTIEQMYAAGWTDEEMAAHLDISVRAVVKRRIRRGMKRPSLRAKKAECGTTAGWQRHRRKGTEICADCRDARNQYAIEWRAKRREESEVA